MSKINEFDKIIRSLQGELKDLRKASDKANPVPFGQERLSAGDARHRYEQMSRGEIERLQPEQRKDMIKLLGVDRVVARLRGPGG